MVLSQVPYSSQPLSPEPQVKGAGPVGLEKDSAEPSEDPVSQVIFETLGKVIGSGTVLMSVSVWK